MRLTLTEAPEAEPVLLAETKRHLRVDDPDDDALIENLITAARQHVEEVCRRQLLTATWILSLPGFPAGGGAIRLPRPPCQKVESLKYVDSAGETQILTETTDYQVVADEWPAEVLSAYGKSWPAARAVPEAVLVEYDAGYGAAGADVPASIRAAILLLVGHLYENREAATGEALKIVPMAVDSLLVPYRVMEEF